MEFLFRSYHFICPPVSPLQPVLPFMKPPTHTAQFKRSFSCFQNLLRKARRKDLGTRWSLSWAHFCYPTSTYNPHKNSDTLQTNIQSCHWGSCIPICTDLSKNVGHLQQSHLLHNLSIISLANLRTKSRQTFSRSMLSYCHQHQWSYKNLQQQRILHQTTKCHPSQNLTLWSTWNK